MLNPIFSSFLLGDLEPQDCLWIDSRWISLLSLSAGDVAVETCSMVTLGGAGGILYSFR